LRCAPLFRIADCRGFSFVSLVVMVWHILVVGLCSKI